MAAVYKIIINLLSFPFSPPQPNRSNKTVRGGFFLLLLLTGILHWVYFFNEGEMSFRAYDWPKERLYYDILQVSIRTGIIPYHIFPSPQYTNRFLANPETVLSPQIILLSILNPGQFVMVNTILCYIIGFSGCWLISRRYQMAPVSFLLLFLLFNFNGIITSHIAVGHSMWNGYFILPFLFLLLQDVLEKPVSFVFIIKVAFVFCFMLLQGSLHLVIGCWVFFLLIGLFNLNRIKTIALIFLVTIPLAAARLVPALFTYWDNSKSYISGYPSLIDLLESLILIREHDYQRLGSIWGKLGWWEFDAYIGISGLAFIILFAIILRIRRINGQETDLFARLDIPLMVITCMAINYFYVLLAKIPLLSAERVVSRFITIPLVWLIIIAAIHSGNYLKLMGKTWKRKIFIYLLILELCFSLFTHSHTWRISRLELAFVDNLLDPNFGIIQISDPVYYWIVNVSWAVSILTGIIYLGYYLLIKTKKAKPL